MTHFGKFIEIQWILRWNCANTHKIYGHVECQHIHRIYQVFPFPWESIMEHFSSRNGYETEMNIDWREAMTYYSIFNYLIIVDHWKGANHLRKPFNRLNFLESNYAATQIECPLLLLLFSMRAAIWFHNTFDVHYETKSQTTDEPTEKAFKIVWELHNFKMSIHWDLY